MDESNNDKKEKLNKKVPIENSFEKKKEEKNKKKEEEEKEMRYNLLFGLTLPGRIILYV